MAENRHVLTGWERRDAKAFFEQLPKTDRGWVAHDLSQAAEARRSGDLEGARHHVETARQDRIPYQQQELGLSR
jgi:hypothetical protein